MNVPKTASANAEKTSARFQSFSIPRRSWTISEWTNAVIGRSGRIAEFSTGSQPQKPPQPSVVYAHHAPRMLPTLSSSHDHSAHGRTARIQRPSMRPESSAAAPSANGTAVLTRPASMNGGCTSIAGSTSSGLSPVPSSGVTGLTSNGEARNTAGTRNAARIAPLAAVACAAPHGMRGTVTSAKAASMSESSHVQNSSEPGWPL